uniref:Transposase n=1 Tax=Heterorhabditis bacteriophora TaxID=37862 RepID=A0A1I7WCG2_HETBA
MDISLKMKQITALFSQIEIYSTIFQ